jgi:hypothetical protein
MSVHKVYKITSKVVRNEIKNCTTSYTSGRSLKHNIIDVLSLTLFMVVWVADLATFRNGGVNLT